MVQNQMQRQASVVKAELHDLGHAVTYRSLSAAFPELTKVVGSTVIDGTNDEILVRLSATSGNAADGEAIETEGGTDLLDAALEGQYIEGEGQTVVEIAEDMSGRLGADVLPPQVLDALGLFGNEETRVDMDLSLIERRLREQGTRFDVNTFGAILEFYRTQGHIGLMPSTAKLMLRTRVSGIESWKGETVLSEDQQKALTTWLNVTHMLCIKMAEDALLPKGVEDRWVKNPSELNIDRRIYVFTARCGHEVEQWHKDAMKNLGNANQMVGTWSQLCEKCAEVRARLLMEPPDAAKEGHLTCTRCHGELFRKGIQGLIRSRGDLWQNGMRNVMSIITLLDRLLPVHKSGDSECIRNRNALLREKQASERDMVCECDNEIAEAQLKVLDVVNQSPHLKRSMTEQLPEKIRKIRVDYGFPESDAAYTALRVRVGVAQAQPSRKATTSRVAQ